jgi:DUF1365 family protein
MLREAGVEPAPARILLLCYPRVLGFAFNPLAVYFCYDADARPCAMVYEVRNTFGDRHSYVEPVRAGELTPAGLRQEAEKLFYVSPFLPQALRYRFRLRLPTAEDVAIRILECDAEAPVLSATFTGRFAPITDRTCLDLAVSIPFMTLKVVLGIHWEALKLAIKGAGFFHRPAPPPPASLNGTFIDPAAPSNAPSSKP